LTTAVPFFLGFSTFVAGSGGAGLPIMVDAVAVDWPGASLSDGAAAEEAFRARPSLLIFSEMLIVDILSVEGVASRELVEGSFLTEVAAGGFLAVVFGVELLEEEATGPEGTKVSLSIKK
jgi:hypothetical protein